MLKKLLPFALTLVAFAPPAGPWFSGKIVYRTTYDIPANPEMAAKVAEMMGSESYYYIGGNNFKMYNGQKQLMQLYTGSNNQVQMFMNGQAMPAMDASQGKPGAVVQPLPDKATIAGYECQSLKITNQAAGTTTTYFYAPKLRVDPQQFSGVASGDFNTYLKATSGALPLRTVTTATQMGMTMNMTQEATSVTPMPLTTADFVVGVPAK